MKRIALALLLGGILIMACKTESTAKEPWQQSLCESRESLPATAALSAEDSAVEKKFAEACPQGIFKISGLHFKEARNAYLCHSFVERDGSKKLAENTFGAENIAAADILPREGFMGKNFAAIVLTDAENNPDAVILRRTVMEPLLESIESAEAAALWAMLKGETHPGPGAKTFCDASVTATETGWKFSGVESFRNCDPVELLDLEVTQTGKITVLSRQDKTNPDGTVTAICVD